MVTKKKNYTPLTPSEKEDKYFGQIADSLLSLYDRKDELADSWEKPWTAEYTDLPPMNGISEHKYKGKNGFCLWLKSMINGYTDPRWVTFKQVADEGGNVKRGEKGTTIKFFKDSEEVPDRDENGKERYDKDGKVITKEVKLAKPIILYVTVFNLNQCENIPLTSNLAKPIVPEKPKTNNTVQLIERADHYMKASGAKISFDGGNRAYYSLATDDVHLPKPEYFKSAQDYYHTAFHELTHWTGAEHRLKRPYGIRPDVKYAREEFVADLGSHLICRDLNLVDGKAAEQLMGYLGSWYRAIDKTNDKEKFRDELIGALKSGFDAQSYLNKEVQQYELAHPEEMQSISDRIYLNTQNDEQVKYATENMAVLEPETQKLYITYDHDVTRFSGLITDYEDVLRKYQIIHSNELNQTAANQVSSENSQNDTEEEIQNKEVKLANAPSEPELQSVKEFNVSEPENYIQFASFMTVKFFENEQNIRLSSESDYKYFPDEMVKDFTNTLKTMAIDAHNADQRPDIITSSDTMRNAFGLHLANKWQPAIDKYNLATYGKDVAESSKAIISRLHTDPVLETLASYQTRVMDENREFNPTKISELFEQLQNGKEKVVQEFERTYNVSVVTPNTLSKENSQEVNDNNLKYVFCWQCFGNDLKPEQNFAITNKESGLCYLEEETLKSETHIITDHACCFDSLEEAKEAFSKSLAVTGCIDEDCNGTVLSIDTIRTVQFDQAGNYIPESISEPLVISVNPAVENLKEQYAIRHEQQRTLFQRSIFDIVSEDNSMVQNNVTEQKQETVLEEQKTMKKPRIFR